MFNQLNAYAKRVGSGTVSSAGKVIDNVNPSELHNSEGMKKVEVIKPSFVKKGEAASKLAESLIARYLKVLVESSGDQLGTGKNLAHSIDKNNAFFKFDQGSTSTPVKAKLTKSSSK